MIFLIVKFCKVIVEVQEQSFVNSTMDILDFGLTFKLFCLIKYLTRISHLHLFFRPPNPIEYLATYLLKNKDQYEDS